MVSRTLILRGKEPPSFRKQTSGGLADNEYVWQGHRDKRCIARDWCGREHVPHAQLRRPDRVLDRHVVHHHPLVPSIRPSHRPSRVYERVRKARSTGARTTALRLGKYSCTLCALPAKGTACSG